MRRLTLIGFAVATALAGCESTNGAPAHQHDHENQAGMMAGMCLMMSLGSGDEPAPVTLGDADHNDHNNRK